MIRVSLTFLIYIYLFLFLAGIFFVWLLYEWRRQRREKRALQFRIRCEICGFDFEDRSTAVLPRCPRCGSLNERYKLKII
jgi:DNA-directed RNA polymerase subunit RPC12/RpoP